MKSLLILAVLAISTGSDLPPPPPYVPMPIASPKAAEQQRSLGKQMAKSFVPTFVPLPQPFTITVSNGMVTLAWTYGTNVQVQASSDFGVWTNLGTPTTAKTATFPVDGPRQYYRLAEIAPESMGTCSYQRSFGGTNSNGGAGIKGVAVDSQGNIVIVGLMYYGVNLGAGIMNSVGGQDVFIAKYNPAGVCLWSKRLGGVSNDSANGVAIDSSDNIIVIGSFSGPPFGGTLDYGLGPMQFKGGSDIFIVKYDANGNVVWSNLYGGTGADIGIGVALDSSGNILITGTYGFFGTGANFGGGTLPTFGQQDIFLAKFTAANGYIWQKGYGGPDSDLVSGIAVDGTSPLICGNFRGTSNLGLGPIPSAGDTDAYVARYNDSTGNAQWVKTFGDTRSQSATGVAVDSAHRIYVTGDFIGDIDFGAGPVHAQSGGSVYTVAYNEIGTFLWQQNFGAPDNGPHASGIVVDSRGPLMFGEMVTGIDFGTGWLLGEGGNDVMLVQFNFSGSVVWAKRGAPFGDRATAGSGSLVIAGDNGIRVVNLGCSVVQLEPGTINNSFWTKFNP